MHFGTIIENPEATIADLCYPEDETGDNPIMIAAKLRHKDVLNSVLRSPKFDENCDRSILEHVIHYRNEHNQTLLHTVALQGPELEEQKLQILRKEIQLHVIIGTETHHVTEQIHMQRCLRNQLKSSAEAAIILDQCRALQVRIHGKSILKPIFCAKIGFQYMTARFTFDSHWFMNKNIP